MCLLWLLVSLLHHTGSFLAVHGPSSAVQILEHTASVVAGMSLRHADISSLDQTEPMSLHCKKDSSLLDHQGSLQLLALPSLNNIVKNILYISFFLRALIFPWENTHKVYLLLLLEFLRHLYFYPVDSSTNAGAMAPCPISLSLTVTL